MIGYITVGTNNFDKSAAFYDELFQVLNIGRFMENEKFIVWGRGDSSAGFSITKPFDGAAATVGNGVMIALSAVSKEQVDAVHAKALELGGKDEGPVGAREEFPGFYVGYFRDLDGNKINIHHITMDNLSAKASD
tara:strand:- start:180 stop:584 length:405 start_codon:yes stop_codon:yes gene_type:complete